MFKSELQDYPLVKENIKIGEVEVKNGILMLDHNNNLISAFRVDEKIEIMNVSNLFDFTKVILNHLGIDENSQILISGEKEVMQTKTKLKENLFLIVTNVINEKIEIGLLRSDFSIYKLCIKISNKKIKKVIEKENLFQEFLNEVQNSLSISQKGLDNVLNTIDSQYNKEVNKEILAEFFKLELGQSVTSNKMNQMKDFISLLREIKEKEFQNRDTYKIFFEGVKRFFEIKEHEINSTFDNYNKIVKMYNIILTVLFGKIKFYLNSNEEKDETV